MLKYVVTLTLTGLLCSGTITNTFSQNTSDQRRIDVTVAGVSKDTIYLANYYGNKLYYADTTMADAKGHFVFQRKSGYKAGVYAVVVPGPKYFEILVDEPEIVLHTDTADLLGHLVVKKSQQNQLFVDYIKHLNVQQKLAEALKLKIESASTMKEKDDLKAQQKAIDPGIRAYQQDMVAKAPGTLLSLIINMSIVREPLRPLKADGTLDQLIAKYWTAK